MNQLADRGRPIPPRRRPRFRIWLLRHAQVALASLGRLARSPLSSLMTILVIGIALSLPTGLHLLLKNVQQLGGTWDGAASISLYLMQDVDQKEVGQLAERLRSMRGVDEIRVISRDQALNEFRQLSGFSGALEALEGNPLPAVLVVKPDADHSSPASAKALLNQLQALDRVEFGQLDLQWVRRFQAITEIARRAVLVLASLLAAAVLLIVVNTIRLEIQNRHAEIEVTKLIGGTDAFIRRPFLYLGIWYGLFGGIAAGLLVGLSLWLLKSPVARLSGLYNSDFGLTSMDLASLASLIAISVLLGLCGAWLAVARHLNDIEPS